MRKRNILFPVAGKNEIDAFSPEKDEVPSDVRYVSGAGRFPGVPSVSPQPGTKAALHSGNFKGKDFFG